MAIVRIISSQQPDRLKTLPEGVCRFGADFGCDVVLIDEEIQPVHFSLRVGDAGIAVMMQPGAVGELLDRDGQSVLLEGGQEQVWQSTQFLRTAGLEVHIGGAPVQIGHVGSRGRAMLSRVVAARPRLSLLGVTAVLSIVMIGNTGNNTWMGQRSTALGSSPSPTEAAALLPKPEAISPPGQAATVAQISKLLSLRGLQADSLQANGADLDAVFYLDSVAERDAALAAIRDLPIRPRFYLRTQLLSAVRIMLEGSEGKADLVELNGGDLVLGGLRRDDEGRAKINARILRDVAGIKSVTFIDPANAATDDLTRNIAAVWMGKRPYVVLSDGRVVRPGQGLAEDVSLVKILSADRISVRMDGSIQEVAVK